MEESKIEQLAKYIAVEMRDHRVTNEDWNKLKNEVMRRLGNRVRIMSEYIDTKGRECTLDVIYIHGSPSYETATRALIKDGAKFTIEPLTMNEEK